MIFASLILENESTIYLDGDLGFLPPLTAAVFVGGKAMARRIRKHGTASLLVENINGYVIPCQWATYVGLN